MDGASDAALDRAAALIDAADALVIAAGAGLGVDSGLPDFRGDDGFWRAYPALGRARRSFVEMASPATFAAEPRLAWGFYGHRLALYRRTVPHAGFAILRAWGAAKPGGYGVFTSNVDGQFARAGFDAERIHECHGSLHYLQCLEPCSATIWSADAFVPEVDEEEVRLLNALPTCPRCGALARPNVLMFGDAGWCESRTAAQGRAQSAWLAGTERPVVVELGAGTAVPSVRWFAERTAANGGGLVRINPREPDVAPGLGVGLALGARAALEALAARLGAR